MQSVNVKTKTQTNTKQIITDNDCDPLFESKIQVTIVQIQSVNSEITTMKIHNNARV
jgi:hypothetical protein